MASCEHLVEKVPRARRGLTGELHEDHLPLKHRPSLKRDWSKHLREDQKGTTSAVQTIFNLVKNLVGSGMLSLPYAVAAGTGLVPAIIIVILIGSYAGFQFALIGAMCESLRASTFHDLGLKTHGEAFAKVIDFVCTFKALFGVLAFSIVITDSFGDIARSLDFLGAPAELCCGTSLTNRTVVLVGMTCVVLLPLCLIRDLSQLSFTSLLGCVGILYVTCFMIMRFADGTYLPGGKYFETIPVSFRPAVDSGLNLWSFNFQALVIVCNLSTAFVAHYNAPKFFDQLIDRSSHKFNKISALSFGISVLIFVVAMVVGYLTFGSHVQGLVLNNYSTSDPFATAARVALGTSMSLTFPLVFTGARDGMMSLGSISEASFDVLTVVLLSIVTAVAFLVHNVSFAVNLGGALAGSAIIYIVPSAVFLLEANRRKQELEGVRNVTKLRVCQIMYAWMTICLGILLAIMGSAIAVLQEYAPEHLKAMGS